MSNHPCKQCTELIWRNRGRLGYGAECAKCGQLFAPRSRFHPEELDPKEKEYLALRTALEGAVRALDGDLPNIVSLFILRVTEGSPDYEAATQALKRIHLAVAEARRALEGK